MKTKSITIHGIKDDLNHKIQEKSRNLSLSQNKTIKKILEDSLLDNTKNELEEEFADLFGIWSEDEKNQFLRLIEDLETIDTQDWK